MKFILLGAGKIAERFVSEPRFNQVISSDLVGVISSDVVSHKLKNSRRVFSSQPVCHIGDKKCNEKELTSLINAENPSYLLSIQYPWILSKDILTLMSGRVINLHNARLPDYRGHNSISHEIINRESIHTSTLHWVDEEVDRGRVVKTREILIDSNDTAYSLWSKSVDSALILLEQWFADLTDGSGLPEGKAVGSGGRYYGKELSSEKQIPAGATAEMVDRWARAFYFPPHEPAYLRYEQQKIYVLPNTWIYCGRTIDKVTSVLNS